jgi:cold shock CspA family protein
MPTGIITTWIDDEEFSVIHPDDSDDVEISVHRSAVLLGSEFILKPGHKVQYEYCMDLDAECGWTCYACRLIDRDTWLEAKALMEAEKHEAKVAHALLLAYAQTVVHAAQAD